MSVYVPMSAEVFKETLDETQRLFDQFVAGIIAKRERAQRLQVLVELLDDEIELLVRRIDPFVQFIDAAVQSGALVEAESFEHLGESVDEFVAGAGEPLGVSVGEQLAQVRGLLADLRSLVHQPLPVKEPNS